MIPVNNVSVTSAAQSFPALDHEQYAGMQEFRNIRDRRVRPENSDAGRQGFMMSDIGRERVRKFCNLIRPVIHHENTIVPTS